MTWSLLNEMDMCHLRNSKQKLQEPQLINQTPFFMINISVLDSGYSISLGSVVRMTQSLVLFLSRMDMIMSKKQIFKLLRF